MLLKLDRFAWPSRPFWGLLVSLAVLFLMGGSSRWDVQSLALLNPVTIMCCGAALLSLKQEHFREKKWLLVSFLAIIALVAVYILPLWRQIALPPAIADDMATLRAATGWDADISSVTSPTAWQSLFFLFAPLAVLLFTVQLNRDDIGRSLPVLIIIGAVSGILGILQVAGSASGPLYFYDLTNNGSAVGFFANRNHAAVFLACLFPMLALFAAKSHGARHGGRSASELTALALAILLVPLILVTGSRSGMLTAVLGLVGGGLLYVSHAQRRSGTASRLASPVWLASIFVGLVVMTIYVSRAESVERFFTLNGSGIDRSDFWTASQQLFWQYFPLGFGPGAFVPAYQYNEPAALLGGVYLNRLHNDWSETAATFGIPGILIMAAAVLYYLYRSFVLWMRMDGARPSVALGRMASLVIAILATASLTDYPLRTPAIGGFAMLVIVWFTYAEAKTTSYPKRNITHAA